jgi:hypothetical protein
MSTNFIDFGVQECLLSKMSGFLLFWGWQGMALVWDILLAARWLLYRKAKNILWTEFFVDSVSYSGLSLLLLWRCFPLEQDCLFGASDIENDNVDIDDERLYTFTLLQDRSNGCIAMSPLIGIVSSPAPWRVESYIVLPVIFNTSGTGTPL